MAVPRDKDAKRYYRAARERWEDATFLLDSDRTTAAVYLAGYCVECVLKALILVHAPVGERQAIVEDFRGAGAHNYDRLRTQYGRYSGTPFPKDLIGPFRIVEDWGTDLRYQPGTIPRVDADAFLTAVRRIREWADRRL